MKFRRLTMLSVSLPIAVLLLLAGCDSDNTPKTAYTLQLLHFADVDGGGTAALQNVDNFSALVAHFRSGMPDQTLFVSSGDNYIPGPIYQASSSPTLDPLVGRRGVGRGEIAMMNAMGVQASAVGNHDLDGGPAEFAGIIDADTQGWGGAQFPYLSSNLDFSTEAALDPLIVANAQQAGSIPGRLAASAVVNVGGATIGLVGASTPTLASITSTGNIGVNPASGDVDELAGIIQQAVDALTAQGIDKIIVLAHMQQISVEKALATRLNDVDIIVAGGSNTLLADANDILHPGDSAADQYPLEFTSPKDEPVLVVNTDGDYKYLGRLVVDFDDQGRVIPQKLDASENGAWASLDSVVQTVGGQSIDQVVAVADALRAVLSAKDGNVTGYTGVFLEGRRAFVRTEETNLGNLSADANLWYARRADDSVSLSLKNGGGIRAAIGQIIAPPGSTDASEVELLPPQANSYKGLGAVSQLDIETSLAFNNTLSLVSVTAAELWDVMEFAASNANPGSTPGSFPQIGGLRFSFDPTRTARAAGDSNLGAATSGQRVRNLVVDTDGGTDVVVANGVLQGDPGRSFRMVTLNFLVSCVPDTGGVASANCGDGYPFKGLANPDRRDLGVDFDAGDYDPAQMGFAASGSEQDALAEFLRASHADWVSAFSVADTGKASDTRIVNLSERNDPLAP
ncbi:MAG: 5'-nucleotidase C-terminal domain-containing protein [Chromatiales bacterium]|nr:5'-nucleotidase C-terminal domain-containing protein [Chromatiales bacterium]